MSITLVCDDCGYPSEDAAWGLPPGWTGDRLDTTRPPSFRPIHRCAECHEALKQAADDVLAARQALKAERRP